jgi:hypothetical protein
MIESMLIGAAIGLLIAAFLSALFWGCFKKRL